MSLFDIQSLVDGFVPDSARGSSPTNRDAAIAAAVTEYSEHRPRAAVRDVLANGTQVLPVPDEWVDGSWSLLGIEHPVGQVPPAEWPVGSAQLYESPTGAQILVASAPMLGETVRVRCGTPHTLDESTDTIPPKHRLAVAYLAAAMLCEQLASKNADNMAPAIGADRVDQGAQTRNYRNLAKDFRERYGEIVGLPAGGDSGGGNYVAPAATVTNFDMAAGDGGRPIFRRR